MRHILKGIFLDSLNLNGLSEDIMNVISNIQNTIGMEIEFSIDESLRASRCEPGLDQVRVIFNSKSDITDVTLWHELEHLDRICCRSIPMIVECPNTYNMSLQTLMAINDFDNDIEHLSIVPIEISRYPNRSKFWENKYSKVLSSYLDNEKCFRHALFIKHVLPNSDLVKRIDEVLVDRGLLQEAHNLVEKVVPLIDSKEHFLKTYLNETKSQTNSICLEYLDFGKQEKTHVELQNA
jgi:hypothetical protein